MFPSNDGRKMEKYRPSASEKKIQKLKKQCYNIKHLNVQCINIIAARKINSDSLNTH